jgi:hypothetical protein
MAIGSAVEVDLEPAGSAAPLPLPGRVVRVVMGDPDRPEIEPGMAIQFDELSPRTQERLDRIVVALADEADRVDGVVPRSDSPEPPPADPIAEAKREAAWFRARMEEEERRIADLENELTKKDEIEKQHMAEVVEIEEHRIRELLRVESESAAAEMLRIQHDHELELKKFEGRLAEARAKIATLEEAVAREHAARLEAERNASLDRRARTDLELRTIAAEEALAKIHGSGSAPGGAPSMSAAGMDRSPSPRPAPVNGLPNGQPTSASFASRTAASLPLPPPLDIGEFGRLLRRGQRLEHTTLFNRWSPTSPGDTLLATCLEQASDFDRIARLAHGRFTEQSLIETLFTFYRKGLIEFA